MDFGDDDFATAADVSLDVQNYRLRIALDTEQDEAEFVDIAAVGRLVLTNKSRNYSPDSLTSPYAAALRAPHACRRVGRFYGQRHDSHRSPLGRYGPCSDPYRPYGDRVCRVRPTWRTVRGLR